MAIIRVPADAATPAIALAASSSGDVILLADGTHVVTTSLSFGTRTDVTFIAENRRQATLLASGALMSNSSFRRVRFIGINIAWSSTSVSMQTSSGEYSLIDCHVDFSNKLTSSSVDIMYTINASSNYTQVVRNCHFKGAGPSVTHGRVVYCAASATGSPGDRRAFIVENNVFEDIGTSNSTTYQIVRVFGSGTNSNVVNEITCRNNSFINCGAAGNASYMGLGSFAVSGSGRYRVGFYNNYVEANSFQFSASIVRATSPTAAVFLADPVRVRNNVQHNPSQPFLTYSWYNGSGAYADVADNQQVETRPVDDTTFAPLPTSTLSQGYDGGDLGRVYWDHLRAPCAPRVGAFAFPVVRTGCALFVQRQRVPALGVAVTNYAAATFTLTTPSEDTHLAPGVFVDHLRASSFLKGLVDTSDVRVWYDPADGHVYLHTPLMPHNATSDGILRAVLGPASTSGVNLSDLGADVNHLIFDLVVDEDVVADEHRGTPEYTDIGAVFGAEVPTDSARWHFTFAVLSDKRAALADSTWQREPVEKVVARYEAGRQARFWRNMGVDAPWNLLTEPEGYSDIVPPDGRDSTSMAWYDSARTRYELTISGVEVR